MAWSLECPEGRGIIPVLVVVETNLATMRTDPADELPLLLNSNDPNVNGALAFFNVNRQTLMTQWNNLTYNLSRSRARTQEETEHLRVRLDEKPAFLL